MEQYANLVNTSLAIPYVHGGGSVTVASATGLPTAGTFSLTLVNPATNVVLMIFRVTAVFGTLLSGAAEGPDVDCPAGTLVYGTMLTAAAMQQVKADIIGTTLTPPVLGNFIQNNVDKSVVTPNADGSGFTQVVTGQNNAEHLQVIGIAVPLGEYWLDVACRAIVTSAGGGVNGGVGVGFVENLGDTAHQYSALIAGYFGTDVTGTGVTTYSNVTTHNTVPKSGETLTTGPLLWFRLHDDRVVHRDYWISVDGVIWQLFFQEATNALFAPTAVALMWNPFSCGGIANWLSWNLHQ